MQKMGRKVTNFKLLSSRLEKGKFYSVQEISQIFEIYPRTILNGIKNGYIKPSKKVGMAYLLEKGDF